jgi:hypothetical protein
MKDSIVGGYPPKNFLWTGEWIERSVGGRSAAARNRKTVWYPLYRADDGETIADTTQVVFVRPKEGEEK